MRRCGVRVADRVDQRRRPGRAPPGRGCRTRRCRRRPSVRGVGRDVEHPLRVDRALERAGERRGDAQFDRSADLAARSRTASGIAARLASVERPMLAWLCASEADRQYWKLRAPAAAAFSTCRGVATHTQQRCSSSGVSSAITSSVLAIGGTRSGRAIEPISSSGTPSGEQVADDRRPCVRSTAACR